jgi:hypothetical protein
MRTTGTDYLMQTSYSSFGFSGPEGGPEWLTGWNTANGRITAPARGTVRVTVTRAQINSYATKLPTAICRELTECHTPAHAEQERTQDWCHGLRRKARSAKEVDQAAAAAVHSESRWPLSRYSWPPICPGQLSLAVVSLDCGRVAEDNRRQKSPRTSWAGGCGWTRAISASAATRPAWKSG